jgi:hypothetical protein
MLWVLQVVLKAGGRPTEIGGRNPVLSLIPGQTLVLQSALAGDGPRVRLTQA